MPEPTLDHNGDEIAVDDPVIILGTITEIGSGVVHVDALQNGETQSLNFLASDLRKATIDGNDIHGVVSGPS